MWLKWVCVDFLFTEFCLQTFNNCKSRDYSAMQACKSQNLGQRTLGAMWKKVRSAPNWHLIYSSSEKCVHTEIAMKENQHLKTLVKWKLEINQENIMYIEMLPYALFDILELQRKDNGIKQRVKNWCI